jgi:lysophospholipase L1-like esterase/tetratricopeptide (TPR) repeat protein
MQNRRDFFRYLLTPPEIKPIIRSIKIFFHQLKNSPRKSIGNSISKFFRNLTIWIRHSRNKPIDETKPKTLTVMRHMLKRSKPPADETYKSKNIFLYAFRRKKAPAPEKYKGPSLLLHTLKEAPGMNPEKIKKTVQETWFHLKFMLRPRPKGPTSSDLHEMPKGQLALVALNKDRILFEARAREFWNRFRSGVLPYWKHAIVLILIFPVVLEVFLQITALIAYPMIQMKKGTAASIAREHSVLCVGDSFTSGKYTASGIPSYVTFLPSYLGAENQMSWRIANYSSEYLTAEDVVKKVPEILQKQQPDLLYLMIGMNDLAAYGSHKAIPERLRNPFVGFDRTEFHSEMLYRKMRQNFSIFSVLDVLLIPPRFLLEKPPLAGYRPEYLAFSESQVSNQIDLSRKISRFPDSSTWHQNSTSVQFQQNGKALIHGSEGHYSVRTNLLVITQKEKKQLYLWQVNNGELILSGPQITDIEVYHSVKQNGNKEIQPQLREIQKAAWNQLSIDSPETARAMFSEALKINPRDPIAHAGLAQSYFELGRHTDARREIFWLNNSYVSNPDYATARALLMVFLLENSPNDTSKVAFDILQRYPKDPWFWRTIAWCSFLSNRIDLSKRAIDQALELTPADLSQLRASLLRTRADILASLEPKAAIEDLFKAFLLDANEDLLIDALRKNGQAYLSVSPTKALEGNSFNFEQRRNLLSLFSYALDEQLMIQRASLENRLLSIVWKCQQYHVQPILINYPFINQDVHEISRWVAEKTGAGWFNPNQRFENLIKTDVNHLYLNEGRYKDAAGRKIAEWIAEDAKMRLSK